MPRFAFNHLALAVDDVNASVDFYQSVLGLEEIDNTASKSATRWLSLGGGMQLHLIPYGSGEARADKGLHLALKTVDVAAFVQHLNDLGIPYTDWLDTPDKSYVRDDGIHQVYFRDPDGYWVEVNGAG